MPGRIWIALVAPLLLAGCVKNLATGAVADALSGSGGVYGQDDDPELVRDAIPFALKTMEGVLVEQPEHIGLLTALASGFVQYGYAFVEQEAHRIEDDEFERAEALRVRAAKHYRRALTYGQRGLEVDREGFFERLQEQPDAALAELEPEDIPLVYWTAAAWGLVIGSANLDPESLAAFPTVKRLATRALELDPTWNDGALHELLGSIEANAPGGSVDAAAAHYRKALELNGGRRAGTHVSFAENVWVKKQSAREFRAALGRATAIDVDRHPDDRLSNLILQRRARRLLARVDDLFLEDVPLTGTASTSESDTP